MSFNDNLGPVVSNNSILKESIRPFVTHFNVGHMNCQSIKPSLNSVKFDEFKSIINESLLDVVGISETWLKSNVSSLAVEIPGYKFCRNDRKNVRGGGVGMYVSNRIKHKVVFRSSVLGKCESLFVELQSENSLLLVGVVYLPPPCDLFAFENIHQVLLSRYSNIIIVGDFNCNMFNSSKATSLRSLCSRLDLSVVHNSQPTHFVDVHGTTSLIDFMLISDFSMRLSSGQIQCPAISHHALIYASFCINVLCTDEYFEYRDFRNIDWDGLLNSLSEFDMSFFQSCSDANTKCNAVSDLLNKLYSFVPIIRKKIRNCDSKWFNVPEIALVLSLRDLAYKNYRINRSDDSRRIFCKYRNRAKLVIRKHKRRYFGFKRDYECQFECNVDEMNNYFACAVRSLSQVQLNIDSFDETDDSFSFRCVDSCEVLNALLEIKSKCSGVDGIPVQFLRVIYPHISFILLELINCLLMSSVYPTAWKIARVVPIPKADIINSFEDLRPISILPVISKVVEQIIKDQVFCHVRNMIYDAQFGFRKGFSTTSLLLTLTDSVRQNVSNGGLSVLIALDLSKAFNSICFETLILKLYSKFKFSRSACRLVFSYLCGRSQFVDFNSVLSTCVGLSAGVPQGSVLGPLLFVLYINDLSDCINVSQCKLFMFADDVLLLFNFEGRSLTDVEKVINSCLSNMVDWMDNNSLRINPLKSKAMLFGSHSQVSLDLNIIIENASVDFVSQLKCLGIILDDKLNFESHINSINKHLYCSLRRIYSTNLFLPLNVKSRIAHALLMPHILYGIELISGTSNELLLKINKSVNIVVRFVFNVRRHEHISVFVDKFLGCSFLNFLKYRNVLLFYKVIKSGLPAPLYNNFMFSHSSRRTQIFIPRIYSTFFEKSFNIRIARLWNQLPNDLRLFSYSNNVFRSKILSYFKQ